MMATVIRFDLNMKSAGFATCARIEAELPRAGVPELVARLLSITLWPRQSKAACLSEQWQYGQCLWLSSAPRLVAC
jgi:hypothetical protein